MFCQSCGAQVSGSFCAKCGARASQPSPPPAPAPSYTPAPAITAESLSQLAGAAQEQGKEAAKLAKQGIGAMAARMGKVPFGAAVLLWIAWFLLPAANLSGRAVYNQSYTFWSLIGTDFTSMLLMQRATSHGLFTIIGLIASAAPFAVPFLRTSWARYLNAAPLAYVLVAWIAIYLDENKAFGTIAIEEGANPFSLSWGIFVLTFAAIVLAAGALKKPVRYTR